MRIEKLRSIGYWVSTTIVAAPVVLGGAVDAAAPPGAVAFLAHLGYPAYFASIIGIWKMLGGVALLAPRFPRLKEWAYAGIVFDLSGAALSHAAVGDGPRFVLTPVVLTAFAVASWALRPSTRKLAPNPTETEPTRSIDPTTRLSPARTGSL